MSSNIDLGLVTAYGYAVDAGFTGTEAEFAQMLANIVVYKNAAETAANNAALSAGLAEQYKDEAFDTTPAGYTDFVSETNSSLDDLYNTGVKNLLPPPTSLSDSGDVSFTINADGSITASAGTISATTLRKIPIPDSLKGKTLKLSGCPTGGSTTTFRLRALINNEAATGDDTGNGMTFTIPLDSSNNSVGIYLYTGYSGPVTFKPMLTVEDAPNSDYAHYVPYAQSNQALTKNMDVLSVQHFDTRINNASTQSILDYFTTENGHSYLIELNTFVDTGDVASLYVLTIYSNGTVTNVSAIHEGTGNACPVIDANKVLKLRNSATAFTCNGTVFKLW